MFKYSIKELKLMVKKLIFKCLCMHCKLIKYINNSGKWFTQSKVHVVIVLGEYLCVEKVDDFTYGQKCPLYPKLEVANIANVH